MPTNQPIDPPTAELLREYARQFSICSDMGLSMQLAAAALTRWADQLEAEKAKSFTIADAITRFKACGTSPLLEKCISRLIDLKCPHCHERIGTEIDL